MRKRHYELTWWHLYSIIILIILEYYSSWITFFLCSHKLTSGINPNIVGVWVYVDAVIAATAAETKVSLAIDMSVLRISPKTIYSHFNYQKWHKDVNFLLLLGRTPEFALMYPTKSPLCTAGEPLASPLKWKDTLLALSWSFYDTALAVTCLLRAVRGAQ